MLKILIVDDSPSEVIRFESILQSEGHKTQAVSSGEEGIEKAKELLPDIILMDVVMGGMSGFKATRSIRQNELTSHIPVIMVTTKDQPTDRVWAKRQGASAYLTKPVDQQLLIQTIADLMNSKS